MTTLAHKTIYALNKDDYINALRDTVFIWFLSIIYGIFLIILEAVGVNIGETQAFGTGTSFLINSGAAILVAPVLETVIFQFGLLGFLLTDKLKLRPKWAIITASVIFALIHQDISIYHKFSVFIASVVFCSRYLDVVKDSNKLKAVIYITVVHAFSNIIGLVGAYGWK